MKKYPSLTDTQHARAMRDKTYEYELIGLWDWHALKLAAHGWEGVDPAWPPKNVAAGIGWIRRKKRKGAPSLRALEARKIAELVARCFLEERTKSNA